MTESTETTLAKLNGYGATVETEGDYTAITVEEYAPKAFDALRSVLGWCSLFDVAIAEYKPYEFSEFIRAAINQALDKEES
ncbi:hypothetical protein AB0383_20285 [Amycolatopsis sp. NPDC051373]|uniref:hypothetical protein n=1 Tax=Amycolatopsis sp. NPDC051373 TaxID=3155801 RepID=UPI0034505289